VIEHTHASLVYVTKKNSF